VRFQPLVDLQKQIQVGLSRRNECGSLASGELSEMVLHAADLIEQPQRIERGCGVAQRSLISSETGVGPEDGLSPRAERAQLPPLAHFGVNRILTAPLLARFEAADRASR